MTARPDDYFARLIKTLRLLDSPSSGERQDAFEACERLLTTLGLRWGDVADQLPITQPGQPPGGHIARAAKAMYDGQSVLSAWEAQFLVGIEGLPRLSGEQQTTLDRIVRKVEAARAAGRPA